MVKFNFILLFISQYLFITTADLLTNEFAVHIPGGQLVADETARKYGFHNKGQIGSLEGYYLFEHHHVQKRSTTPSSVHLDMLQNDETVMWFEQQQVLRRVKRKASNSGMDFKDPLYPEQWFLNSGDGNDMNVIPAWKEGITGKGIVVTILDDGIQYSHPDLAQNYDKYASMDINDQDDDPSPRDDMKQHGTRCAGEVAATANNEFCGVGIAYNASIGGVRMLDGSVTDSVEATALSLRPDHIHIYSASWGPDDNGKSLDGPGKLARLALENGINKGRNGLGSIFVWASGNGGKHFDNCNCDGYTNSIYTISVSSASQRNSMPWYLEKCSSTLATTYSSGANRDPSIITVDVDYAYVNEMRNSPNPPSPNPERLCTRSHTGTSASAPIAAGICALALEANPKLTWRDMQHIIVRTSNPRPLLKEDGWITNGIGLQVSNKFGFGIMDAGAIVELAKSWQTVGEQKICTQFGSNTEKKIPRNIGSIIDSVNTTACQNGHNQIKYLEHVQVVISLEFEPRGYMDLKLISPRNTASEVLLPRPHDKTDGPFADWPFMSVQFWGEDPRGEWLLKVVNSGDSDKDGRLISWSLVFYGTALPPPTDVNPEREEQPTRVLKKYAEISNNECFDKKQFQIALEGESECTSKCPLGQYGDLSDYTCHACDESCSSCFGPSYKNCLSCQKYFLSNNICAKSCPDGFYPDSQTHQCFPCKPSCETCDSSRKCITCKPGLFLFGKKCLPACPPETYIHQQSCKKCHHTCATCFGPLASQCITCPPLHYTHNSTCVLKCPGHYYAGHEPSCNRCHRSCEFCTDFTSCTKCNPNWERISIHSCSFETKCPHSGWYNPQLGSCDDCDPNCEECSLPDTHNCATCNAGYVWHEKHCTGICPDGYFILQDECSPCDEQCSKCDNRDKCVLCKDGFLLHSEKCYPFCPLGYYDGGRKKCEVCHPACQHCTGGSDNNCASCSMGYYFADNKCHTECPDGFFSTKENDCFPCYSTCKTCTDFGPEYCTSCFDNSTHSKDTCIPCLDGEFYNRISRKCERCHTNCGRCFGPGENNCLSCTAPLRLDEVKHLCLPCCQGPKTSDCCSCSEHLDVCILADYPRSIPVNTLNDGSGEIVIPMKHVIPIVIAVCISVVLLYVILFGILQANSMGLFHFKFGGQKYERVPNMTAKFDADMEKVSLTQEIDDEDEIYEKV
ncbi:hypothetical protein JTE90_013860 [Oedothorax gibbosus]|uniref:furin n=1 Tax=Oedothorax gibbosus TaxID=931172 RepID=A0AAV6VAY3_9ARAC|nr:hypothetical protein JTE90_013860 [Oedothorax gibbosus]